eukprot:INCI13951.1.p1 GENE.INCI13951.1~~INCI13951.1.p1  ORF type:complete len:1158 (+),score=174.95 INCI13951.1:402-3875(+)
MAPPENYFATRATREVYYPLLKDIFVEVWNRLHPRLKWSDTSKACVTRLLFPKRTSTCEATVRSVPQSRDLELEITRSGWDALMRAFEHQNRKSFTWIVETPEAGSDLSLFSMRIDAGNIKHTDDIEQAKTTVTVKKKNDGHAELEELGRVVGDKRVQCSVGVCRGGATRKRKNRLKNPGIWDLQLLCWILRELVTELVPTGIDENSIELIKDVFVKINAERNSDAHAPLGKVVDVDAIVKNGREHFALLSRELDIPNLVPRFSKEIYKIQCCRFLLEWSGTDIVGRQDIRRQLRNIFSLDGDNRLDNRRVALYGLAGVGKTCIASAYAKFHFDKFKGTDVIGFNATTLESFCNDVEKRVRDFTPALPNRPLSEKCLAAHLEQICQSEMAFIVIDNISSDVIKTSQYLAIILGPKSNARVLITSNSCLARRSRGFGFSNHIKVNALTSREAVLLLRKTRTRKFPENEHEQVQEETLVKKMEMLPLAIVQAGQYLRINETSCELFLESYDECMSHLKNMPVQGRTAYGAIALNVRSACAKDEITKFVIVAFGLLGAEDLVRKVMMTKALEEFCARAPFPSKCPGGLAGVQWWLTLQEFSLLCPVRRGSDQFFKVTHSLVHEAFNKEIAREFCRDETTMLRTSLFQALSEDAGHWGNPKRDENTLAVALPAARHIAVVAETPRDVQPCQHMLDAMYRAGKVLIESQMDWKRGSRLIAQVCENPQYERNLDVLCLRGKVQILEGFSHSAIASFTEVVSEASAAKIVRVQAYLGIGDARYSLGDWTEAASSYRRALLGARGIQGASAEIFLATRQLGRVFNHQCLYTEAIEKFNECLQMRKLCPVDKALAHDAKGEVLRNCGKLDEAKKEHLHALKAFKRIWADDQTLAEICAVYKHLGLVYENLGLLSKAMYYFQKQRHCASSAQDAVEAELNVGTALLKQGEWEEARDHFNRALDSEFFENQNQDNALTARARMLLGECCIHQYREDKNASPLAGDAKQHLDEALRIQRAIYPNGSHVAIAASLASLGRLFSAKANVSGSTEDRLMSAQYFNDAYEEQLQVSGEDSNNCVRQYRQKLEKQCRELKAASLFAWLIWTGHWKSTTVRRAFPLYCMLLRLCCVDWWALRQSVSWLIAAAFGFWYFRDSTRRRNIRAYILSLE